MSLLSSVLAQELCVPKCQAAREYKLRQALVATVFLLRQMRNEPLLHRPTFGERCEQAHVGLLENDDAVVVARCFRRAESVE
jgi:hypothetical protein